MKKKAKAADSTPVPHLANKGGKRKDDFEGGSTPAHLPPQARTCRISNDSIDGSEQVEVSQSSQEQSAKKGRRGGKGKKVAGKRGESCPASETRSIIYSVMAIMKDVYTSLPRDFWGLSRSADRLAPRKFRLNTHSLECFENRSSTSTPAYPIVSLETEYFFKEPIDVETGVRDLILGQNYDHPTTLPIGLKTVKFGDRYNQATSFPPSVTEIAFGCDFNEPLEVPPKLQTLHLGSEFNWPLVLPSMLKRLSFQFDSHFSHPMELPGQLNTLILGRAFNYPLTLPSTIQELEVGNSFNHPLTLPPGLKKFALDGMATTLILSPYLMA